MRILVSQRVMRGPHGDPRDALEHAYVAYFEAHGFTVLPLPNGTRHLDAHLDATIGGVVLTGGNDISPGRYGATAPTPDAWPARDDTEAQLLRGALARGLPVYGICRGMQFLNVFFGGTLLPDLERQPGGERHRPGASHDVEISDPLTATALGAERFDANSYHGQAVTAETLAPPLRVFAREPHSKVVEGLYHPELPVAGVQFHPERRSTAHPVDERLIEAFRSRALFWERSA